jgi:uncharacterized protein (TIGR02266 family)
MPRVQAAFRVRYPSLDSLVVAYASDLSKGGMFLRADRFLPINAVVRLQIALPDGGGEIVVICRVVQVRTSEEATQTGKMPGMGLQFLDLSGERLQQIEQFISERSAYAAEQSAPQRIPCRPMKVLVVDDDEEYQEHAAEPFRLRGDQVRVARDGLEALAMCLKEPPEVILSDVQMPRMDGWQFLRVVRSRPTVAQVPFVFLTTLASESERLHGYQMGVDDYLAKPYQSQELVARVDRIVARTERSKSDRRSLRGDLDQVSLAAVMSLLELERKTGVLLVVGERTARLFLRGGQPLRVEIDGASPALSQVDRACALIGWTAGQFEFALQDVADADELGLTLTELMLEAARRVDEASR